MVEAIPNLTQVQRQAQRQAQAVRVLVMHAAKREVKDAIRREGKVKLSRVPQREIIAMARERVMADAAYRARLVAEARPIVDQWTAEGFFGKQAAQRQLERNSKHLSNSQHPGSQGLSLNECHAQNGDAK
jgi:hypothetical protein